MTDFDGDKSSGTAVIDVIAPSLADLVVLDFTAGVPYTNASNITVVVLNATVYNQGTASASPFYMRFTGGFGSYACVPGLSAGV